MKLIPMPEPGDKVMYGGEGEVEFGVVIKHDDQAYLDSVDYTEWQIGIKWHDGDEIVEAAMWLEDIKCWVVS